MTTITKIKAPIEQELHDFEPYFKKSLQSDIPLLATVLNFLYRTKGKQLRPMFVFLSAKLHGGTNEFSKLAACSVELLHTATLVHDDVVDESYERRGSFSVKALWKNKLAVLVGDYILARGLLLQLESKKYNFLHLISRAVQDMAEGEILQMKKSRKLDIDDETYFEIIRKKTASLIATSMAIGAASAVDDEVIIEKMYSIGQDAGIAFQIKDDIFDYQSKGLLGKPTGNDIKEKKITLPLLHVLNEADRSERKRILRLIKRKNNSSAVVKELIELVTEKGGLEFAEQKMNEFKDRAIAGLKEFPDCEARESLIELMNYIATRKK
ncbi:octaprenyl-diphosphate synthase [Draconibacterium orientale]|uniref:Octaprenyl-diphosphate synthase n=1 Tax=Draconibacterium orientale TaxID=1168034 RepID=X5DEY7_9BACT|nr:polyprenyl synthetase family protein [Draconibacterium orientale]AHW59599.1 polyprenyl synthetase [Draconibacterium orientale]SES83231.1 octaprenyl-diphosphate synthase [Draconibacterium orientale]